MINFNLWQVHVQRCGFTISRFHKGLEGRSSNGILKELSGDGGPMESKVDSSKGLKTKVFMQKEKKKGCYECE